MRCFGREGEKIDGLEREYELCDRPRVRVGVLPAVGKRKKRAKGRSGKRYLWMREVRVLREDGRQTSILTNRQDLSAVMVAYRIFNRWRQENYFKYMAEEFALDALVEYGTAELPASTDRPNPQWLRVTRRLQEARAEVSRLRCELGQEAACNDEAARRTMRGFKIAHAKLRKTLEEAQRRVARLQQRRGKIPKRVLATDRVALKSEKKLVADAVKMAAYQVETELLGLLGDHYCAVRRGRTHVASCGLQVACPTGTCCRGAARDHCPSILAASHGRLGGVVCATRCLGCPLPRHEAATPLGRSATPTYHFRIRLCQEL